MTMNRCLDEDPLPDLSSEAIDYRAASELFAPVRQPTTRDLAVLGITTRFATMTVSTVGGILLFAQMMAFVGFWHRVKASLAG